ncbi:MAG: adenosylcobinamide-GDP ribazoletransferase [Cyanobacteria bacterium REEB459]|nr:adenosylcobinamide-GDP ribazoletransferase [Cyanobacteria bacterium REEB459]
MVDSNPDRDPNNLSNISRPGLLARLAGAILFYTCLPLPSRWQPRFEGIATLAPLVGLGLAALLALVDRGLDYGGMAIGLRSGLVVGLWVWLTGGLHLDGAMDTADGLAVSDPDRRLAVMADSRVGAFGTLAAIALLGLKTLALADLSSGRGLVVAAAALWGRWGQVLAIAGYPYLRPAGKGALHKIHLQLPIDLFPGLGLGIGLAVVWGYAYPSQIGLAIGTLSSGLVLAWIVPAWLNYRLGGHTGDSYGATVEWVETLVLCIGTLL